MSQLLTSLYLHFPFCRHLCNYCDFYKTLAKDGRPDLAPFHRFLDESWVKHQQLLEKHSLAFAPLETFYIGGGTPSLWGSEGAFFLKKFFRENHLSLRPGGEFTLEVNPGCWTAQGIADWQDFGINRFSVGLQSLNGDYLKILDRYHSLEDSYTTLQFMHEQKLHYSVDFMLGLPDSQKRGRNILRELEEVLQFSPEHLSLYILTTKSHYPLQAQLPADDFLRQEFLQVSQYLRERGYGHYEVSNFAQSGYESRHNLKYWQHQSVAALGKSATGFLALGAEQAVRFKWKTQTADFEEERLGAREIKLEKIYLKLRTHDGIAPEEFFGENDRPSFLALVEKWQELGYVSETGKKVQLGPQGYLMLDALMDDLFRLFPHF